MKKILLIAAIASAAVLCACEAGFIGTAAPTASAMPTMPTLSPGITPGEMPSETPMESPMPSEMPSLMPDGSQMPNESLFPGENGGINESSRTGL